MQPAQQHCCLLLALAAGQDCSKLRWLAVSASSRHLRQVLLDLALLLLLIQPVQLWKLLLDQVLVKGCLLQQG